MARFPGGILAGLPHDKLEDRVQATARALSLETPAIFGATFSVDGMVVVVDILAREEPRQSLTLIEVASSTSIRDDQLMESAFKACVLRRIGVEVDAVEIMHLNGACRFPDLGELFLREPISGRVRRLFPQISALIADQVGLLEGTLPEVEVGTHCDEPGECPFKPRCRVHLPRHHLDTLYGLRRERLEQLGDQGLALVGEVPESFPLTVIQRRQKRSVTECELQVEGGLTEALAPFQGRMAFLDFEAVKLAIPAWDGLGPWEHHPVQFSCQIASQDGNPEHVAWLSEGPEDCRSAMARALVDALEGVDTLVAYDKTFGTRCLELIAAGAPDRAPAIQAMKARLRDLLPIVRRHVYHRDFLGSFSLETVLPALLPDFCSGHPAIIRGPATEALLHRLLFGGNLSGPAERDALRRSLLDHGAFASLALLRLKERLDVLGETGSQG